MKNKIAIIGLGYVGLPLAVEFGKKFETFGYDIDQLRINQLKKFKDKTGEVNSKEISLAKKLKFTYDLTHLSKCNIYIITVPTPIDEHKRPDLACLMKSSEEVGTILCKGDIVIYESTVYPGATEEVCIPILEESSQMLFNKDFFCGYSPERINPGDKEHTLTTIKKITYGSTPIIAQKIDQLYKKIVTAGTYMAKSIKIAEAAKVIENTQRDVNIALINELAIVFNRLEIDTEAVLEAAGTKWNFLPFRPGLVGGHCIGVDPYYLTYKAMTTGFTPEMILAGRKINDGMGSYIANQVSKLMTKKSIHVLNANILIMGLTFKENCSDIRNTRVIDLIKEFKDFSCNVDVFDPWVDNKEALQEYDIETIDQPIVGKYDAILLAVGHHQFRDLKIDELKLYGKDHHIIYDIKYLLNSKDVDGRL